MSGLRSVAVVGAGRIGKPLTEEFLRLKNDGKLSSVGVLTRTESQGNETNNELRSLGANVLPVDYESVPSLVWAFSGVDVVVSVLGLPGFEVHDRIAEAAKQAGVKLFVPSEFGISTDNVREDDFLGMKTQVKRRLKELDLPYAVFYTGNWHDFLLSLGPFGLDYGSEKVTVYGTGDSPISWTTRADIARYVGYVLTSLPLRDLERKTFRIEAERLSWNQLNAAWEAKSGKKLTLTRISREQLEERAKDPKDRLAAITLLWDQGMGTVGTEAEVTNRLYPDWNPTTVLDVLFP